jgi:hypothetical protein
MSDADPVLVASFTADHREALRAFLEKRPPTYTNT